MGNIVQLTVAALMIVFATFSIQGEAKAYFVFGDSLVDNGNNNYLITTARADSPPYGIDSPDHRPSGRFSNGYNFADMLGKSFGWEPILPYLSPDLNGDNLLKGANFASAGVGILNDTGIQFINIIRIYDQIANFETYKQRLSKQVGDDGAKKIVDESLYLITLGGNDFINNYYLVPFSLRSQQYPLQDYCALLISEYKKILKKLYDNGARRVIVTGTGPLGCVPVEIAQRGGNNGECSSVLNEAANVFNPKLTDTVLALNKEVGSDVFTFTNTNQMHMDFLSEPTKYGFETSKDACCGQGPYNGLGLCTYLSNLCSNRDKYVFWDAVHPTERASKLIVEQMMNASTKYMTPMNLSTIKFLHFN